MKLSTKGRYGVRLMLDLALNSAKSPVTLKDIAARQDISKKYLWQLIYLLKKAGLIISSRGARAGYVLAKSPAQIDLKDIVCVLEGKICLVECVDNPTICKRSGSCVSRDVWQEATEKVSGVLESFTLEKMMKKHRARISNLAVASQARRKHR